MAAVFQRARKLPVDLQWSGLERWVVDAYQLIILLLGRGERRWDEACVGRRQREELATKPTPLQIPNTRYYKDDRDLTLGGIACARDQGSTKGSTGTTSHSLTHSIPRVTHPAGVAAGWLTVHSALDGTQRRERSSPCRRHLTKRGIFGGQHCFFVAYFYHFPNLLEGKLFVCAKCKADGV